jgi:O-antigen/teichoic acid export membrane protein
MAYAGYGVWSLVFKTISMQAINSSLLWLWNKWRPTKYFSRQSFKELFSFGSKLLVSGLIDTAYRNICYLVIGKYFSAAELGYYTRADMFKDLPAQNINGIISRVSYPVLATLQDNNDQLKAGYKRIITCTMLITFVLMMGMAAVAESMVITLIGDQWRPSIIYLQMLCFVGMLYPLHALNLNILNVKGRSDLFLKLEIIKKILAIPTIVFGALFGLKIMIAIMIATSLIGYYLNSYWAGRFINYPMREQIADILPSFGIALLNSLLVYASGYFLPDIYFLKLILQILIGAGLTFILCELLRLAEFIYIKDIIRTEFIRGKAFS